MRLGSILRNVLPPLVPLVLITLVAEVAVQRGWVRSFLVPAPSSVIAAIRDNRADFIEQFRQTAIESFAGFGLSIFVGISIAIVLSSSRWIERTFYPYAVFFQTVPIVAIAPLLVIWIGFDIKAIIVSSFIVSVFPVIANTLAGLRSTDPALRDMFKLYRAGPVATLLKLRLPYALPNILTGLRISAGLAVIGAIVGEFITYTGLGGNIPVARQQQRVDLVFAGLLLATLLGILLFMLVNLISRLTLRNWHASEAAER